MAHSAAVLCQGVMQPWKLLPRAHARLHVFLHMQMT